MADRPVRKQDLRSLVKVILVIFVWLFLGIPFLNTVITVLPESYPPKLFITLSVTYDSNEDREIHFCSRKPFTVNIDGSEYNSVGESKRPHVPSDCLHSLDHQVTTDGSKVKHTAIYTTSGAPFFIFSWGIAYIYLSALAVRNVHFIILVAIVLFGLFYAIFMWYRAGKIDKVDAS